jgi:hypothetical protein
MVMRLIPGASKSRWPTSTATYHFGESLHDLMHGCGSRASRFWTQASVEFKGARAYHIHFIPLIAQRSSAPSMGPVHEAPSSSLGDHLPGRLLVDRKACHHFTRSVQFSVHIDHPPFLSIKHIRIPCHPFILFHDSCLPPSRETRERKSVIRFCRTTP